MNLRYENIFKAMSGLKEDLSVNPEKRYEQLRSEEVYEFLAVSLNGIHITREMAEKMKTLIEIHVEVDYAPEAR